MVPNANKSLAYTDGTAGLGVRPVIKMRGRCKSSTYKDAGNKAEQDLHFKERFFSVMAQGADVPACLPAAKAERRSCLNYGLWEPVTTSSTFRAWLKESFITPH